MRDKCVKVQRCINKWAQPEEGRTQQGDGPAPAPGAAAAPGGSRSGAAMRAAAKVKVKVALQTMRGAGGREAGGPLCVGSTPTLYSLRSLSVGYAGNAGWRGLRLGRVRGGGAVGEGVGSGSGRAEQTLKTQQHCVHFSRHFVCVGAD